ncbi:hypothetical protein [Nonomuraea salmonea]|uniref:hypothetical protein n=1 Tax=Nonomuraea salmonea TaxID=46181 RepID=UPI0031EBBA94
MSYRSLSSTSMVAAAIAYARRRKSSSPVTSTWCQAATAQMIWSHHWSSCWTSVSPATARRVSRAASGDRRLAAYQALMEASLVHGSG